MFCKCLKTASTSCSVSYSKKNKPFENLRKNKLEKTQYRTLTILYDGMNNLYFNIMQILLFFWYTGTRPAKPCLLDKSTKLLAWLITYMQRPVISKISTRGWRDSSAVRRACCSSRGLEFGLRKRLVICLGLLKKASTPALVRQR